MYCNLLQGEARIQDVVQRYEPESRVNFLPDLRQTVKFLGQRKKDTNVLRCAEKRHSGY